MRILITAGPTREPIDLVRYISNRSSGKMGVALAMAALSTSLQGGRPWPLLTLEKTADGDNRQSHLQHSVTMICGPINLVVPIGVSKIEVETSAQMHQAVLQELPRHDLLIMAAAVADYRPKQVFDGKLPRVAGSVLELEPTVDIIADAAKHKRPDQRIVGFSLESEGNQERARQKMLQKSIDLMVYNPIATMDSDQIECVLFYPDGRTETLPCRKKGELADILIRRAVDLF